MSDADRLDRMSWDPLQRITVTGGDYSYEGYIVCLFVKKRSGELRFVVEDDNGILFIHNAKQVGLA